MAPEVISRSLYGTEVTCPSMRQSSQKLLFGNKQPLWPLQRHPSPKEPWFSGSHLVNTLPHFPLPCPLLGGSSLACDFVAKLFPKMFLLQLVGKVGYGQASPCVMAILPEWMTALSLESVGTPAGSHWPQGRWTGRRPTHQRQQGPAAPIPLQHTATKGPYSGQWCQGHSLPPGGYLVPGHHGD